MQYVAPQTTKDAVALMAKAKGAAYVLAGGTDLLVRMKGGFIEPDLIVDIKRIKSMRETKKTATGFQIGAAVSGADACLASEASAERGRVGREGRGAGFGNASVRRAVHAWPRAWRLGRVRHQMIIPAVFLRL